MIKNYKIGKIYCLKLNNNLKWQIVSNKETNSYVEKLASIMELRPCKLNENPKLIFVKNILDENELKQLISNLNTIYNLPKNGWRVLSSKLIKFWTHHSSQHIICEIGNSKSHISEIIKLSLSTYPIYKKVIEKGCLPLHSALIEKNGNGILLVASGNGGKSSCCNHLPSPWHAICDDEAVVVLNKDNAYSIHPFPTWSNCIFRCFKQTWNVQQHFPLTSIFFLKKDKVDKVIPLEKAKTIMKITKSANEAYQRFLQINLSKIKNRVLSTKIFDNSCEIAKKIPSYTLHFSLNGKFWSKIDKVIPNG